MSDAPTSAPDSTAVRVALWRALHVQIDPPPHVRFFAPSEMLSLAREAGLKEAWHVSAADLTNNYFGGRSDGLRVSRGEEFPVAAA